MNTYLCMYKYVYFFPKLSVHFNATSFFILNYLFRLQFFSLKKLNWLPCDANVFPVCFIGLYFFVISAITRRIIKFASQTKHFNVA